MNFRSNLVLNESAGQIVKAREEAETQPSLGRMPEEHDCSPGTTLSTIRRFVERAENAIEDCDLYRRHVYGKTDNRDLVFVHLM